MGFIAAYKRLDKLCGEVMSDERRVSAYIDEMRELSDGRFYVRSWDADLKNLKHCRGLRNQIVHEPGCTEQNMCTPEDERWVNTFYSRILQGTDPLTLYRKATNKNTRRKKTTHEYPNSHHKKGKHVGCLVAAIVTLVPFAVALMLVLVYAFR